MTTNTIQDTGFGDTNLERAAKAIFDAKIAPMLTHDDIGKYLVIDTEIADYSMNSDSYTAAVEALRKNPGGRRRFCVRVGYRTAGNAYLSVTTPPAKARGLLESASRSPVCCPTPVWFLTLCLICSMLR